MSRSDLNQSYAAFDQASTIACVIELSSKSWLAAGTAPGMNRQPLKKLPAAPTGHGLLAVIERWRGEADKAGNKIERVVVQRLGPPLRHPTTCTRNRPPHRPRLAEQALEPLSMGPTPGPVDA